MSPDLDIDGIEERFFVHGRMEILALLNELIYRHEPVHIHFGVNGCLVTRLLEAREQALVFEAGKDAEINRRLATSPSCVFVAWPDGIRVQFSADQVQQVSWGGSAACSVAIPARLARLQRQESFRVLVPQPQAPHVTLYAGDGAILGAWPLHDLSAGGLSVAVESQAGLGLALAPKIARVRLELAGHGIVDNAVILRHATALTQRGGFACRIGLGFVGLQEAMRVAILRYIVDVEHARRNARMASRTEG
ncbi:flagellar brake protein [Noviherbaspirillum sedimenti]|uniref:Flagellar brake protein n=1 Tax=Noviherbaspirillum sedimenti TaxID=2320865 RepID=A0A3A3G928_9BURK|nr:flagellar brake protein [Noviherbaspirillum sedimenti]RJG03072.1 flagellar brake protein [Noviherbaspirillum sedimenti]